MAQKYYDWEKPRISTITSSNDNESLNSPTEDLKDSTSHSSDGTRKLQHSSASESDDLPSPLTVLEGKETNSNPSIEGNSISLEDLGPSLKK